MFLSQTLQVQSQNPDREPLIYHQLVSYKEVEFDYKSHMLDTETHLCNISETVETEKNPDQDAITEACMVKNCHGN